MERRSGTELLGLLCNRIKKSSSNVLKKKKNLAPNKQDGDEQNADEPEQKKSRQEHRFTFSNVTWSSTAPEIQEPLNLKTYLPFAEFKAENAKNVTKPLDAWSLLFSQDILEKIVQSTNKEIKKEREEKKKRETFTDVMEIKALLGLLYFCGITKDNHSSLDELWSPRFGNNLYKCVMAQARFKFLLSILHCEALDISTKQKLEDKNKLAPIKYIWDVFISNCTKYYSPSANCTIDRTYVKFKGICNARVIIPNTNHYGIKITCLNDAETSYMIKAELYAGSVKTKESESEPSYYIRKLSEPLRNTKRNITCDDWFTSVEIVQKMKKEYLATIVGAICKNKQKMLSLMKTTSPGNTHFAYANGNTLVSYSTKKNVKVALLLSSLHKTGEIDGESGKPEIVSFYDSTKSGTKIFNKLCETYSTARKTERWPLRLFFSMLDQAGVNSAILYNLRADNLPLNHRDFLKELAFTLIKPYLTSRLENSTLPKHIRAALLLRCLKIKKTFQKKNLIIN